MTPTRDNPITSAPDPNRPAASSDVERSRRGMRERVSEMSGQAKKTASDFGRSAADNIDRNLDKASGSLENAASTLRQRAGHGGTRMKDLAHTTADKLDATARYFRGHHTREMMSDAERVVRGNPGASMAAALAVGFLIGVAMRRDRY